MGTFTGKNAIVTGAGSGIGRGLALTLAEKGAQVIVTDVDKDRLAAVIQELPGRGHAHYKVDHGDLALVEKFHKEVTEQFDHIDVLCLNAGVGLGGAIHEMELKDWQWLMQINYWGVVYMLNLFSPAMIEQQSGHILITASGAGLIGIPGMSAYCSSKFAMVGIAESLRAEMKKYNVVVSALCPGIINTNIVKDGKMNFEEGSDSKSRIVEFYEKYGEDPINVAKDGVRALEKDIGVMPSPANTYLPWMLKRFSSDLWGGLGRFAWARDLLGS